MNAIKEKLTGLRVMMAGESYWSVRMSSGKVWSELDEKSIEIPTLRGPNKQYLVRRLEWKEDLIDSGDIARVKEIHLHTPQGIARTHVGEPYTGFQFSRGTSALLTGEKLKNLQAIGAVVRSEEHTSELQSPCNLVCRLLLEKKNSHAAVDRGPLGAPDGGVRCPAANAGTPRGVRVYRGRQYAGGICRPHQIRYRSTSCGRS